MYKKWVMHRYCESKFFLLHFGYWLQIKFVEYSWIWGGLAVCNSGWTNQIVAINNQSYIVLYLVCKVYYSHNW